jgi:uncharacterized protein (TIGR02646 family)
MKYIVKSKKPKVLLNFKNEYRKKHGRNAVYGDITPDVKNNLKSALLEEQHFICCYCMKRINQNNSHIEHIKPQVRFPSETLDYSNLLLSCNGISNNKDNCGHRKDDWYNAKDFLTPINPDCEKIFTYSITGKMDALKENGKITISKLNLNSNLLVRARKEIIRFSGLFDGEFKQKKQEILAYNTMPNRENELPPYCMAVIYCINNYGNYG